MNVINFEEARQRLEEAQESHERRALRDFLRKEIQQARDEGILWTTFRPFFSDEETAGKTFCTGCCGRRSSYTARRAHYVSYATFFFGCATRCTWCYAGLGEIADKLSPRMRNVLVSCYDSEGNEILPVHHNTQRALIRRGLLEEGYLTEKGQRAHTLLLEEAEQRVRAW